MKRGKDEKIMGPMFPRLHVNDTEKGGPRAPPRNKMALYEQLSVPAQRFNHGVNTSNSRNLVPLGSSSQGSGFERNLVYHQYVPQFAPTHMAEKFHNRQPDGGSLNTSLAQSGQRKKEGDEDDFRVPVFVQPGIGPHQNKTETAVDKEKPIPFDPNCSCSLKIQNLGDSDLENVVSSRLKFRQDVTISNEKDLEICALSMDHSMRSSTNLPTKEKTAASENEAITSPIRQSQDNPMAHFGRLHEHDNCLLREPTAGLQPNDNGQCEGVFEVTKKIEKKNDPPRGSDCLSGKICSGPNEPEIDHEYRGDKTYGSVQLENGDKSNNVLEISMVDSMLALDISPDDVVGVIGQKHFRKARRAIVNQQRVFAVQVFELHRLIKVQRLIAGSPHLLLEDGAYLGGSPKKGSLVMNLPSECVIAPQLHIARCKDDSEKPNHRMECSAENAVGKTSLFSVKNGSQPSNSGHYSENLTAVPAANEKGPLCFPQPVGHQWLIPVMSPSEGLIYKPYTAPGYIGSVCGGCGPFGPIPMTSNFMSPAYGIPASHPHQGIRFLPGAPLMGHGYFPPYSMPIMKPAFSGSSGEQMNCFAGSQTAQISGSRVNSNLQCRSSCNVPIQKRGSIPQIRKFQASKGTELQGSTGSSSSERMQGVGTVQAAEGGVSFFPMAATASEGAPQPQATEQSARVIKVVPLNPRSANESAARIFLSIQEERKQYDSL